jgi:hypothetical protein
LAHLGCRCSAPAQLWTCPRYQLGLIRAGQRAGQAIGIPCDLPFRATTSQQRTARATWFGHALGTLEFELREDPLLSRARSRSERLLRGPPRATQPGMTRVCTSSAASFIVVPTCSPGLCSPLMARMGRASRWFLRSWFWAMVLSRDSRWRSWRAALRGQRPGCRCSRARRSRAGVGGELPADVDLLVR